MPLLANLVLSIVLVFYQPIASAQIMLGWLEPVTVMLDSNQILIQAKIDSGADHSSLHAKGIQRFMKDNQAWVKFTTVNELIIEALIHREANIKTKIIGFNARPVILLKICLAGIIREIEVNLMDREHFSKPLLIGRSALSGFIINPNQIHMIQDTNCNIVQ